MIIRPSILPAARGAALAALLLGVGLVGTAAQAADLPTTPGEVPRLALRYSASALDTDQGARLLYRRLVYAAAAVCPDEFVGTRLPNPAVERCRANAVARAVQDIGSNRLAAVHANAVKSG